MAQFTVRNLEDSIKTQLRRRAVRHGNSLEQEVRQILRNAVKAEGRGATKLGSRISGRFARVGLSSDLPELRGQILRPAQFDS